MRSAFSETQQNVFCKRESKTNKYKYLEIAEILPASLYDQTYIHVLANKRKIRLFWELWHWFFCLYNLKTQDIFGKGELLNVFWNTILLHIFSCKVWVISHFVDDWTGLIITYTYDRSGCVYFIGGKGRYRPTYVWQRYRIVQ
jgi:hypothetical protein